MNAFTFPNASTLALHSDVESLAAAVAQRIVDVVQQTIAVRGVCRIALAGGETPRRCYEQLCPMPVDWGHVHIYFGDERCLPVGDAQRNDTMAQHALLRHIAIPANNVHSIPAEIDVQVAASRYALELHQAMPFDLVLLGMGEDGHTASLFPGDPALQSRDSVVAVFDAPKPPPQRVSLGLTTLRQARQRIFLVAGASKRAPLAQIFHGAELPAARVGASEWHVDRDAIPESF